jgi:hypothetical protein
MTGPDDSTAPDLVARLDAERAELRSEIAGFLNKHPYRVKLEHDAKTSKYRIWHDGAGAPIPEGIFSAAARCFSGLLDAHERGYGEPSTDWEALSLVRGRVAEVLEPILLEGKTRLVFCDGRPTFGNSCPICGPFRDGQVIAIGAVNPQDTEIEFIPVFEIAFKGDGGLAGPLAGRVVIDFASALCDEVREAVAGEPSHA